MQCPDYYFRYTFEVKNYGRSKKTYGISWKSTGRGIQIYGKISGKIYEPDRMSEK